MSRLAPTSFPKCTEQAVALLRLEPLQRGIIHTFNGVFHGGISGKAMRRQRKECDGGLWASYPQSSTPQWRKRLPYLSAISNLQRHRNHQRFSKKQGRCGQA
jgi:hypothetical protein